MHFSWPPICSSQWPLTVVRGDALFYDWGQGLGSSHTAMQVGWGTDQYGCYENWVDEHTSNRQDILVIKRYSWKYKLGNDHHIFRANLGF
jgi:hypothetical protein